MIVKGAQKRTFTNMHSVLVLEKIVDNYLGIIVVNMIHCPRSVPSPLQCPAIRN